jgi:hypothetical protein
MTNPWFEVVGGEERLTQGDLIFRCPLVGWNATAELSGSPEPETLAEAMRAFWSDVVVMTQACDLEHDKVTNVVLCPHEPISLFRSRWEEGVRQAGAHPSAKAWRRTGEAIAAGYIWHQTFLNTAQLGEGELSTEVRVVDFRQLYTVPRRFLESLLRTRGKPRLRLLPPYREHLSQAFARFFMRVGLPQAIPEAAWNIQQ